MDIKQVGLDGIPTPERTAAYRRPLGLILALLCTILLLLHNTTSLLLSKGRGGSVLHLHPHTSAASSKIDWSFLHVERQCPAVEPISGDEFTARRTELARLLRKGEKRGTGQADVATGGGSWAAYITEPGPNALYYVNLSQSDWYLSERPWIIAITPSGSTSHLTILTPAFELSRSKRLPFALTADEWDNISWVVWQEAEDPYRVLLEHLDGLRRIDGQHEGAHWRVHLEENVREFVSAGLGETKVSQGLEVGFASLEVREQRMRKTQAEFLLQRCVAKITLEALRAVRKHLYIGMTEKEGEALIHNALSAGGLTDLGIITLFGENAALPHASASASKRLEKGEFALFDVDGSLFGYQSDFTRTMLPDVSSCHGRLTPPTWPSERVKLIWETVSRAQHAALAALVPVNSSSVVYASDIDKAARSVIAEQGWETYFSHRLGHGIGLQVHEAPYLNSGNRQPLQPGQTFSNEPGIYIESDGDHQGIGVRLEDMVMKTKEGWELVSGFPLAKSPWEL